jgi:ribosomal protein S18 acetylase RimI-like enzyme
MAAMRTHFIPYNPSYEVDIQQLERCIVQGKKVQLTMLKDHFLDRSVVFKRFFGCLGINEHDLPISTSAAAKTSMVVNKEQFDTGFCYDVKVHPAYRNQGIGRQMTRYLYDRFFTVQQLARNFTTLKLSNAAVIRLAAGTLSNIWLYSFVYLTIPTRNRVQKSCRATGKAPLFSVTLFPDDELSASYYTDFPGGLGCFHTYRLYRLKIQRMGFLYKQALRILKVIRPKKHGLLPAEHDVLEFVTLYNHNENNISQLNEVLAALEKQGKKYLLVCCQKNDSIYRLLKKIAVHSNPYYILSDFPLKKKDEVTIDVRCL